MAAQQVGGAVGPPPLLFVWLGSWLDDSGGRAMAGRAPSRLRLAVCGSVGDTGRLDSDDGGRWRVLDCQIWWHRG
jgi:hypothetical protein